MILESDNHVLHVEMTTPTLIKTPPIALRVETKECIIKLTRLETILADDLIKVPPSSASDLPAGIHFTRSRSAPIQRRLNRKPRRASANIKYEAENGKSELVPPKSKSKPMATKPSRLGPSENRIKSRKTRSVNPVTRLPALKVEPVDNSENDVVPPQQINQPDLHSSTPSENT